MMQLLLSLGLGTALIVVLYALSRRNARVEGSAQVMMEARKAVVALQGNLLPPAILVRIFEKPDYEYVVSRASQDVQKLFLEERRRIAISWVKQIRRQILSLKEFHRGTARFYSHLSLKMELQLAAEFMILLAICRSLHIAIRLGGPYAAPRMVARAAAAAGRVCDLSEKSLAFLKPAQFDSFARPSVGNPTLL